MGRFLVHLQGENFLLSSDGEHNKYGFKAHRVVRADTAEEAERIAMIRILQELNRNEELIKNIPDQPRIKVIESKKLGIWQPIWGIEVHGFEFFAEEGFDRAADPEHN